MSVAENPTTEKAARTPQQQFAIGSAVGAVVILAAMALIFGVLPLYWREGWESVWKDNPDLLKNLFLADALLILLELLVIGGLAFGAYQLLQQQPQPGLRAGIVFGAVYLFVGLWFVFWLGGRLKEGEFAEDNPPLGWALLGIIYVALAAGAGYVYLMVPGWLGLMETVEHQGWFHATSYKGNQGIRVRRGSIVGILAVGVTGIITLITYRFFGYERSDLANDWYWVVPFSNPTAYLCLMFKVHLLMPIVFGVALLWLAWRVVNIPPFADFLIATEAEMNKVSWTNRKRLVQDTIVVLTTVFLFTMFLFVVDVIWIKILSAPYIQVLLYDPREKQQQQQETTKW